MYKGFDFKNVDYIQYKKYETMMGFLVGVIDNLKMLRYGEYMSIVTSGTEMMIITDFLGLSQNIKTDVNLMILNIGYDGKYSVEDIDDDYLDKIDSDLLIINEDYFPYSYFQRLINKTINILFYHIGD